MWTLYSIQSLNESLWIFIAGLLQFNDWQIENSTPFELRIISISYRSFRALRIDLQTQSTSTNSQFYMTCILLLTVSYVFRHNFHPQGAYTSIVKTNSNKMGLQWACFQNVRVLIQICTGLFISPWNILKIRNK